MNLKEVFEAIGTTMLSDFEHIHKQIKHHGERGSEREAVLKRFLGTYLPSRYAVSDGEIVDAFGQTSCQCDLIIYDPFTCPLLLAGKDYRVFPAEPIFAVIEVKSVLTNSELEDAVKKIKSVKDLNRKNGPIIGAIFAFKSGRTHEPTRKIGYKLQELSVELLPYQYTDLVCVLDSGIIELRSEVTRKELSGHRFIAWIELNVPTLLWFFITFLDLLDERLSISPDYAAYADSLDTAFSPGTIIDLDLPGPPTT